MEDHVHTVYTESTLEYQLEEEWQMEDIIVTW